MTKSSNRYHMLIEKIFFDRYYADATEIRWAREDLETAATDLGLELPKNLGDVVYAIRYRLPMPDKILKAQPEGLQWVIRGQGRAKYAFKLLKINRIAPREDMIAVKIPDATPEIIAHYALSDEQALLAKVRYNRLIDIFLGLVAYSLQNHLRTTVNEIGQIEIDEIYVGVDSGGRQYIVPVQAKGGNDQLSVIQTEQDIQCCSEKYPTLIARAISVQFIEDDLIALFELAFEEGEIRVVQEKHYRLTGADQISDAELARYASI